MKHFDLGRSVCTSGINFAMAETPAFVGEVHRALARHTESDFSEMSADDIFANLRAVTRGDERIFSRYQTSRGRIWIITEADRSLTTILFPNEY
jgi:hypothetical protein